MAEKVTARVPFLRVAQCSAKNRSSRAAPSAPARCGRRTLQSRHARQSGPTAVMQRREIHPDLLGESLSLVGEVQLLPIAANETLLAQTVVHQHAEVAGEMIVAHARLAHGGVCGPGVDIHRAQPVREPDEILDHRSDFVVREPKVPVAPDVLDCDESRSDELREM